MNGNGADHMLLDAYYTMQMAGQLLRLRNIGGLFKDGAKVGFLWHTEFTEC